MKRFVGFIKSIQESDDDTKHFWHYVFSGILSGLVILIWVANFNFRIPTISFDDSATNQVVAQNESKTSDVAKTFVAGLSIIYNQAKDKAQEENVYEFTKDGESDQLNNSLKLSLPKEGDN